MSDAVDAAIAAASAQPPREEDRQVVNVTIWSTQRVVAVDFPVDLTDGELAEWMGWMGSTLLGALRTRRAAAARPRIEVARAMPADLTRRA